MGAANEPEYEDYLEEARAKCREALAKFRSAKQLNLTPAGERDRDLSFIPTGPSYQGLEDAVELVRGRLYLVDEPERHLHPRRQREAAQWLADTARRYGSQVVIATHAVPFMAISEGARYTYLTRAGGGAALLEPLIPAEMTQLDVKAQELGRTRGELMTMTNVFLWVEGPMDEQVLKALLPDQLRDNRIVVAQMGGHSRATALFDAALLRFTEAPVGVWLDKIPGEYLTRLREEPDYAQQACDQEREEERKTLAKVVLTARQHGHHVQPVGGERPGDDVFDLLDEKVIKELFPNYPGHADAQEAWKEAVAAGWKGGRKGFWERKLKTPITVESCTRIAERMRERGLIPEELAAVIEDCERLSLEFAYVAAPDG